MRFERSRASKDSVAVGVDGVELVDFGIVD